MPEIGGKKFAEDFRTMLQTEVAKAIEDGRTVVRAAVTDLTDTIREQSKGAAKMIHEEARVVRETFSPTTGNNPPEGDEKEDPTSKNQGGGT